MAGAGGRKEGRNGSDVILEVPVGTIAFDADTGEMLADLGHAGERAVVARGGPGGGGNIHRASSINRTPTSAGPGEAGEERNLRLELHLPIDVALVGLPNAGKSTLLSALTAARPKIAAYPYTTTQPELGVMFGDRAEPVIICEIPGDEHLRHLDRARVVVLVVDATSPADLARISHLARGRVKLVVYTKSDLVKAGARRRQGTWMSAETGVGVDGLRLLLLDAARDAPPPVRAAPAPPRVSLRPAGTAAGVLVRREDGLLEVSGLRIAKLLERYDLTTAAGFDRFQVALDRMGVSSALADAGAQPGDTVRIGAAEFEYQP